MEWGYVRLCCHLVGSRSLILTVPVTNFATYSYYKIGCGRLICRGLKRLTPEPSCPFLFHYVSLTFHWLTMLFPDSHFVIRITKSNIDNSYLLNTRWQQWGTNKIRLPDRWRHFGSGGWRLRKSSVVCLHNNVIVARCILDTNIALWATRTASAPSILLVLLEPYF